MSQQRTSKDKGERKYTSIACLECRKRKVKVRRSLKWTAVMLIFLCQSSAITAGHDVPIAASTIPSASTVKIVDGRFMSQ